MPDPADTIREALLWWKGSTVTPKASAVDAALAALTELEQQVAALTRLADENFDFGHEEIKKRVAAEADRDAAEARADALADEYHREYVLASTHAVVVADRDRLREALDEARDWIADDLMPGNDWQARLLNRIDHALDRQEQT